MITHAVGISLGASSAIESGVAVMELSSHKLIYIDKMFQLIILERKTLYK